MRMLWQTCVLCWSQIRHDKARLAHRVGDWLVAEACTDQRPRLVMGADFGNARGVAYVWDEYTKEWQHLPNVQLPRATLLWAEIVTEQFAGSRRFCDGVHALDAAVLAGDDIRHHPYQERHRRLQFLVDALSRDEAISKQTMTGPSLVRLKKVYALNEVPKVLEEARARKDRRAEAQWHLRGLLFFPGEGEGRIPPGPRAEDWDGPHTSKSRKGEEYWVHKHTRQSVWSKKTPASFKNCMKNLLRWCIGVSPMDEDKLVRLIMAAVVAAGLKKPSA